MTENKDLPISRRAKQVAVFALLFNTLIWGGTFVIIKSALDYASPLMFVTVRFGIASLVLLLLFSKHLRGLSKKNLIQGGILGVVLFMGFILQTIGLQTTTATKSAFLTGTFVIFTPIIQVILEKKLPTKENIISIIVVVFGIILLSSKETSIFYVLYEVGSDFTLGDFLTLLCALLFAFYIVYLDIISKDNDYRYLTFMQVFVTFLLSFFFAVSFDMLNISKIAFEFHSVLIYALLYTSLLATVLNLLLQTRYQPRITPTRAGIIFSFEPIFAAFFAYVFINEKLSEFGVVGAVLIFSGILISEIKKNK